MKYAQIIDNALDKNYFEYLNQKILHSGPDFQWVFQETVAHEDEDPNDEQFYFISTFYSNNNVENQFYYQLKPLFEFLDIKAIIRARAIMYTNQGKQIIHGSHIDFEFDHKSALLYMNTCNGFTLICDDDWDKDFDPLADYPNGKVRGKYEQGNKIMSVENRIAIHNGAIPHCSSTCTDDRKRILIVLNYF
jgi:hypothetical protein